VHHITCIEIVNNVAACWVAQQCTQVASERLEQACTHGANMDRQQGYSPNTSAYAVQPCLGSAVQCACELSHGLAASKVDATKVQVQKPTQWPLLTCSPYPEAAPWAPG
jgi:hypothetical protein